MISCEGPRGLRPEAIFKQGRRRYCWCWHRLQVGGSLDLCKQPSCKFAPVLFLCNQNLLLLSLCGKGCSAGRGEHAYLREHSQIWPDIQGFCSRNLEPHPAPNRTVKAPEKKEVSALHLATDLAQPNFPGDSCWHTLRTDVTCGPSTPAPPPPPADYGRDCTVMLPHKITPSRP